VPTPAAVMKRRLSAFEARAAEIRRQITVLEEEAARVEGQIARWRIGSEIWEEVEQELRGDTDGQAAPCGPAAADSAGDADPPGKETEGQADDRGGARYVPRREDGVDLGQLPGLYSRIVEIVRGAEGPMRVRDVVEALFGEGAGRSRHEGVRCQLKRLVRRDWLTSGDGRSFSAVL
jgi:hypothetical protein